jgi:hypothetical protein
MDHGCQHADNLMKLLLKVIGVIVVIGLAGLAAWLAYSAFFGPRIVPEGLLTPQAGEEREGKDKIAADAKIKPFSNEPVLAFWVNQKNNTVYYLTREGKLMKSRKGTDAEATSPQSLPNFHELIPSPDGSKAIASFYYPNSTVFAVFDAETNTWERLPEGIRAADFNPAGDQIAYLKNDSKPTLSILNLKTKQSRDIMPMRYAGGGKLQWRAPNELYLIGEPNSGTPIELWIINIAERTLRRVNSQEPANMLTLSRDALLGLSLQKSGAYDISLNLLRNISQIITPLYFKTMPSKCMFKDKILYCAVPKELPARVNLPEDYLKEKFYTTDVFIYYDTETGAERDLFNDETPKIDAEQLNFFGNQLLFRNRYDGKIYGLEIGR